MQKNLWKSGILFGILLFGLTGCSQKPEITAEGFAEEEILTTREITEKMLRNSEETETETMQQTEKWIQVFVCGAVVHPDVYRLPEGARIHEAVKAAGGFAPEADKEWLNLADILADGEKLRVYTLEESEELRKQGIRELEKDVQGDGNVTADRADDRVNLNTAGKEQLMTLPGIGEAKAEAVISYREEHGGFRSIEEIKNISGIKDAVFSKIKDKITVENSS